MREALERQRNRRRRHSRGEGDGTWRHSGGREIDEELI
jgi:hypothetical protein